MKYEVKILDQVFDVHTLTYARMTANFEASKNEGNTAAIHVYDTGLKVETYLYGPTGIFNWRLRDQPH